jgi:hypothetical protein
MNTPIYIPIFRLRQEEKKVLLSFDFGHHIYPYIEIIKEHERVPSAKKPVKPLPPFSEVYLRILSRIRSDKVFVDLPVHMADSRNTKPEVLSFLRTVVNDRKSRTDHVLQLSAISKTLIPVVSSYFIKSGEPNSIALQAADLRPSFDRLGFRTNIDSFFSDIQQITSVANDKDFFFVDLEGYELSGNDDVFVGPILKELNKFNRCPICLIRNVIPNSIKNYKLEHGQLIQELDNSLLNVFKDYSAQCFGDYAGIKKDPVEKGGGVSPGFIFYDAVENSYYGYRATDKRLLSDFETRIVPDVISSRSIAEMQASSLNYLSNDNKGWGMLQSINLGNESGQNQAKFKRISMEHYLHCVKMKIENGDFGELSVNN